MDKRLAKKKYHAHKSNTRNRVDKNGNDILFKLTFDEWLQVWIDSGFWDKRGRTKDSYVMSRKNDLGHYELGNVFIQSVTNNHSETYHPPIKHSLKESYKAPMLNKKGSLHPRSIRIQTPLGIFDSIAEAARAHRIAPQSFQHKIRRFPNEYKKLT